MPISIILWRGQISTFAINIIRRIDKIPTTGVTKVETIQLFFFLCLHFFFVLLIPSNDVKVNPGFKRQILVAN